MGTYTYHPSTGEVHAGDTTKIDTSENFSNEVVASVKMTPKPRQVASEFDDQAVQEFDYEIPIYDSGMLQTIREVKASGYTGESANRRVMSVLGDANRQNLRHLQMIRLIPQLLAFPESYFHLHNMFTEISVPQLEVRVSLQDVYEQQGPVGRSACSGFRPPVCRGKVRSTKVSHQDSNSDRGYLPYPDKSPHGQAKADPVGQSQTTQRRGSQGTQDHRERFRSYL